MHIRYFALLLTPALLFGQLSTNTVSATASASFNQQPDQAVFSVTVSSGIDKNLSDIVGAISGLGITAANLTSVNSSPILNPLTLQPQQQPPINWYFQLTVPLAKVKDTMASLAALQKTIGQANNGLTLSFSVQGTQVSAPSQTCDLASLVNDARTQAQKIAGPAGLSAGAIVGITNSTSNALSICSLNVKFALGGMIGQPGPNSITITATRTTNTPPDQALIGINLTSGLTVGLDDVTSALTGAGIAGATFTGVGNSTIYVTNGNQTVPQSALVWQFTMTAPLAKLKDALAPLPGAQQTIAKQNSGLTFSFYVEGAQLSAQAQQAQPCAQSDLMSDARTQAQKVAVAAGVVAGPILSISDNGATGVLPGARLGQVTATILGAGAAFYAPVIAPASCALTVQFQLQ
jgi:uncharacterized protein YggE